jgi:hypothetical protein
MDPNQPVTQSADPLSPEASEPENKSANFIVNNISQKTGEIVHNNYETWLRKLFGFLYTILKFIRFTIMQIISQVFSK